VTVWTFAIGVEAYVTAFTGDDRRRWDTAAAPREAARSPQAVGGRKRQGRRHEEE
jgi:hypothetical protein